LLHRRRGPLELLCETRFAQFLFHALKSQLVRVRSFASDLSHLRKATSLYTTQMEISPKYGLHLRNRTDYFLRLHRGKLIASCALDAVDAATPTEKRETKKPLRIDG
jgi:hypothetical protein